MDPKDIKADLKEAKAAIIKKDYTSALKFCRNILKYNKKNYTALVLLGVALQDSEQKDQAIKAFEKAIQVAPDQILAWQGMASYLEKEETVENRLQLLTVYKQLIELEHDISKFSEICSKLCSIAVQLDRLGTLEDLGKFAGTTANDEQRSVVWNILIPFLLQRTDLPDSLSEMLLTALSYILQNDPQLDENYYKIYLKLHYKWKELNISISEAQRIQHLFPNSEFPLEWICKGYSEQVYLGSIINLDDNVIEECYTMLKDLRSNSVTSFLAMAASLFVKKDFTKSREIFKQVAEAIPHFWCCWGMLCKCHLKLHCYSDLETCAEKAIHACRKNKRLDLLPSFKVMLAKALSYQNDVDKCTEAIAMCEQIIEHFPNDLDILKCLANAHMYLGNKNETEKYVTALECHDGYFASAVLLRCQALIREQKFQEALFKLSEAVDKKPDAQELWLEIGKLHWEQKNYPQSIKAFVKATKLDPHCYTCFLYLGNYFSLQENASESEGCYEKALTLNPRCMEAGIKLSDLYRAQNNTEASVKVLTQMIAVGAGKWAWLRLGLLHTNQGHHEDAITCLRAAIRLDPTDRNCWESLADAYYARGAHLSALKSYQRVVELDPQSIYSMYQIASIKQIVGLYEESIVQFKYLLINNGKYVPALKGLGEACLQQARMYKEAKQTGRCKQFCQEAVDWLTKGLEERKDLSCLWKLLGDVCVLVTRLSKELATLTAQQWLVNPEHKEQTTQLSKEQMFELATKCYCRALSISPDSDLIWHDLAVTYNLHANCTNAAPLKSQLRLCALAAAKKSLSLAPNKWQHWNTLGVVATSTELCNYALAQHAFINSIQAESNAVAWTNLGTLYLFLRHILLANKAFTQAQRINPLYIECWIGQALIAEHVENRDAMDLFRHTTELGTHPESCLGYGHWVCTTLLNWNKANSHHVYSTEKMFAIAADAISWYTAQISSNSCAYNMLGLLLERQKKYRGAAQAFECGLGVSDSASSERDMLLQNCGRVLVQLQRYDEAAQQYLQVKEPSFHTQCGLALAYYKQGGDKYKESYSAYETALGWLAPNDGSKSHVLAAMAAIFYNIEEYDDCKTVLFQCTQLKPVSVEGLFAMCSLGMLHSDLTMTQLSLKELAPYRDQPEYMTHIAIFNAYTHSLQGGNVEAIRSLSNLTHRHPAQASLWLALALLLLHLYPDDKALAAGRCAQSGLALGKGSIDVSKVMSLVSLSNLLSGKAIESLRSSQKAVHMFPDISENWVVLIASFLPWCTNEGSQRNVSWLRNLIGHVRRKLDFSRPMRDWLSNHERKVSLLVETNN